MIEKAIIKVIAKTRNKEKMKILSAIFSQRMLYSSFCERMDKKENKLLAASIMHATPVNSSIMDTSLYFDIFSVVKTMRQKPNKLEEVVNICCELPFGIKLI